MTAVVSQLLRDPTFQLAPGFILGGRLQVTCSGRTRFQSGSNAHEALSHHHHLTSRGARGQVRAYRCWHCHGWHIGSRAL